MGRDGKGGSLKAATRGKILESMLNGGLRPGDIINRRQVAASLGVSTAPVHEAMVQLESEGLLEAIPRKGTRVRRALPHDVRDLLIVREAIECEAARLYCGDPVARNLKQLKVLAAAAEEQSRPPLDLWQAEINFHRALVALADCDLLLAEFDRVMTLGLFLHINLLAPPHAERSRNNHDRLVTRLRTKNPDEAEFAVREHVRAGKEHVLNLRRNL
jgi:GntR family transcriptional regulator, rspAB operon transcriptional repressor